MRSLWPERFRPTLGGGLAQNPAETCRLGELRLSPFQERSRAGRVLVRTIRVLVFIGAAGRTVSASVLG